MSAPWISRLPPARLTSTKRPKSSRTPRRTSKGFKKTATMWSRASRSPKRSIARRTTPPRNPSKTSGKPTRTSRRPSAVARRLSDPSMRLKRPRMRSAASARRGAAVAVGVGVAAVWASSATCSPTCRSSPRGEPARSWAAACSSQWHRRWKPLSRPPRALPLPRPSLWLLAQGLARWRSASPASGTPSRTWAIQRSSPKPSNPSLRRPNRQRWRSSTLLTAPSGTSRRLLKRLCSRAWRNASAA
ncbi:hypothetical protein LT25_05411 [Klebsiella pneumoniae]|nr:hypothetical protein LT25_05411 [Klebsiella pneumoniae]